MDVSMAPGSTLSVDSNNEELANDIDIDPDQQLSFPSDHHMHHALAKALYMGEPTRLAPVEIPSFLLPSIKVATGSLKPAWTVEANGNVKSEMLWLITEPFVNWASGNKDQWRLQLMTSSKDQGWMLMKDSLSFEQSWFEFGIRSPKMHTLHASGGLSGVCTDPFLTGDLGSPKLDPITGSELRWHSHNNLLFAPAFAQIEGKIIEADHELWDYLKPNDMVAVYMCARSEGRKNHCIGGSIWKFRRPVRPGLPYEIVRKILRMADILSPHPRSLDAEYVFEPYEGLWEVSAIDAEVVSELWIVSVPLSRHILRNIAQVQLETVSRDQGWADHGTGSSSWFTIGVLHKYPGGMYGPRPGSGLWKSHSNRRGHAKFETSNGIVFQAYEEPLSILSPGDRLTVWMHAQFPGWSNHAMSGRLLYREYFEPTLLARYEEDNVKRPIAQVRNV